MEELFHYCYTDGEIYEHKWAEGDIVQSNNLALCHSRGMAGVGVRTPQRVTITELGYADQYPTYLGTSLGNRETLAPLA